jgi:predicted transcriptional regulator
MISLFSSPVRLAILARLKSGPATSGQLMEAAGSNASTVSHALHAMADAGLVAKGPSGVRLTGPGRIQAALVDGVSHSMAVLEEHRGFWASHDLSGP